MPRKIKPVIYVFWEGESEEAYSKFLKKEFENTAIIKNYKTAGLFNVAVTAFSNDPIYRNKKDAVDEIWFFFDIEANIDNQWKKTLKAINRLRKLRETRINIRLLMTTGCIEYWLLLHYERTAPAIVSKADKKSILNKLKKYAPQYEKGDKKATLAIAAQYQTAVENGDWSLKQLQTVSIPSLEDCDMRNAWLFEGGYTFTTVHEAIEYLQAL